MHDEMSLFVILFCIVVLFEDIANNVITIFPIYSPFTNSEINIAKSYILMFFPNETSPKSMFSSKMSPCCYQ